METFAELSDAESEPASHVSPQHNSTEHSTACHDGAGNLDDLQHDVLNSDSSFIPTEHTPGAPPAWQQQHAAAANDVVSTTAPPTATYGVQHSAASSPSSKPTYAELQLRCQVLESALEQQQQSSHVALSATLAAHAAEEASIREYYEAQLVDLMDRLADVHEASAGELSTAAAPAPSAEAHTTADANPATGEDRRESSPVRISSPEDRPAAAAARAAASGKRSSPLRSSRARSPALQQQFHQQSPAAAATAEDAVVLLRRELGWCEGLLQRSQDENRAAAKRIKDLEGQLSAMRAALAEESSRAQRAAASAAEVQRSSGSSAAERLSRILQLEGQLAELQSSHAERESLLLSQLEASRQQRSAAEARAAAAEAGHDTQRWQVDDALVVALRGELSSQAEAHRAELTALRDKLQWYVENQSLLTSVDDQLACQAATINSLQQQLQAARGASGRSQKQRIQELEAQVSELHAALTSRRPAALAAAAAVAAAGGGPAESAALAAAQQQVAALQAELEQQQQQQERSLRALQQQYEALKGRLEEQAGQLQSSAGSRAKVKELTQQLQQQQSLYTRRVRALEAKLAAAGGSNSSSRRVSAASSSSRPPARGAAAGSSSRRSSSSSTARRDQQQQQLGSDHVEEQLTDDTPAEAAEGGEGGEQQAAAAAVDAAGLSQLSSSAVLRLRDRQLAALTAKLDETTTQLLQLQQKHRVLERQLKGKLAAAAAADQGGAGQPAAAARTTRTTTRPGSAAAVAAAAGTTTTASSRSPSPSPTHKQRPLKTAAAAAAGVAAPIPRQQQRSSRKSRQNTPAAAAAVRPSSPAVSDILTHSPDIGSPRFPENFTQDSPVAAAAASQRPWPLMQQQQHDASVGGGVRSLLYGAGVAGGAAGGVGDASSWPGLCAELEGEVEELRGLLLVREQEVLQLRQQLAAPRGSPHRALAAHTAAAGDGRGAAAAAAGVGVGVMSLSALQLVCVADEVAARETHKWSARLAATEQALIECQSEAAALRAELAAGRSRGAWSPGLAAFEALEHKIAKLEAAAAGTGARQGVKQGVWGGVQEQQGGQEAGAVQLLLQQQQQRYEAVLATKTAELEGFRQQVEGLLGAARLLQQQQQQFGPQIQRHKAQQQEPP